jgi:putative transposase
LLPAAALSEPLGIVLNGLDQLWVADITYLHLAEEFGYRAVILDAFSRKVVGRALQARICGRNQPFRR